MLIIGSVTHDVPTVPINMKGKKEERARKKTNEREDRINYLLSRLLEFISRSWVKVEEEEKGGYFCQQKCMNH